MLRRLGWHYHRVHSFDLFADPDWPGTLIQLYSFSKAYRLTGHRVGAIVAGQTSVKAPEREAFETYLPRDVYIVSCHSLHGPHVDPRGQPLVLIQHRAPDEKMRLVERILACLESRYVYMSYDEHDTVTANTQAVTHAAFLTMGTAWAQLQAYPWATGKNPGGMETVKIYLCLRIYGAKWHVYAGLAG